MRFLSYMVLLFGALTAQAGVYKWVDSEGKVHYSDKPNSGTKQVQTVTIKPTVNVNDSAAANAKLQELKQRQESDQIRKDVQQKTEKQKAAVEDTERARKCLEARSALQDLSFKGRLYRYNKDGEREWIGDDERDAKQKEFQDYYNNNCK